MTDDPVPRAATWYSTRSVSDVPVGRVSVRRRPASVGPRGVTGTRTAGTSDSSPRTGDRTAVQAAPTPSGPSSAPTATMPTTKAESPVMNTADCQSSSRAAGRVRKSRPSSPSEVPSRRTARLLSTRPSVLVPRSPRPDRHRASAAASTGSAGRPRPAAPAASTRTIRFPTTVTSPARYSAVSAVWAVARAPPRRYAHACGPGGTSVGAARGGRWARSRWWAARKPSDATHTAVHMPPPSHHHMSPPP